MKRTSTKSPWVYGKGKPLSQAMGSGKNTEALLQAAQAINALPQNMSGGNYPASIYQDELAGRLAHAAQPAQAVFSDMLPTVYKAPEQYVKPVYPGEIIQDSLSQKKPNFQMMGEQKLLSYEAPKVYPSDIIQDDLAYRKPNFTMVDKNLPALYVDDAVKAMPKAPPVSAWTKGINSLSKFIDPATALLGAKVGTAMAGLPGPLDVAFPNYANASEGKEVADMYNAHFYNAVDGKNLQTDPLLLEMLKNPPKYQQPSGNGNGQPPSPPKQPVMAIVPSPSGESTPASNTTPDISQSQSESISMKAPLGGGYKNVGLNINPRNDVIANAKELDDEAYREMIKRQQSGFEGKLASSSAFGYTDLSPLAALVDDMTGSQFAKSYNAPKGPQVDMANINGLGQQLSEHDLKKRNADIQLINALKEKAAADPFAVAQYKHELKMKELAAKKGAGLNVKDSTKIKRDFSNDERVKDIDLLENFNKELDSYKATLKSVDGKFDQLTGAKRSEIERLYNKLETTINRDYAKLGALAGQDLTILQNIFKPMTGFTGLYNNAMAGGIPAQIKGINDYMGKAKSRANQQLEVVRDTYPMDIVGDQYSTYTNRIKSMNSGDANGSNNQPANIQNAAQAELARRKALRK